MQLKCILSTTHMKGIIILLTIFFAQGSYAQTMPDAIVGKWLKTPKEDLIIRVYKAGNEYKGKIIKEKEAYKNKTVGFVILENLQFDNDKQTWNGGKIHDPNSGKTYDAEAKINEDGSLEVNCYKGLKFIGTKKYFKRIK